MAHLAENVAMTNNRRELYKTTKRLAKKSFNNEKPLKDKQGKLLTTTDEQIRR